MFDKPTEIEGLHELRNLTFLIIYGKLYSELCSFIKGGSS